VPLAAVAAIVAALTIAAPAGTGLDSRDPKQYAGLGTWIDIYSPSFGEDPERIAASLSARGVRTLFVETGNYRRRVDIVRPRQLSGLIDAAHARGISVVAWYLPGFTKPAVDFRRALAAAEFVSAGGGRFDSFALDIEASVVRNADVRTQRLLALSRRLREAVGPEYPLGAIIPSPVGMTLLPHYWPGFPYAELARTYDVLLPMAYFSYRAHTAAAVRRYVQTSVAIIRNQSGDRAIPLHVIGGLAEATSKAAAEAFVRAAAVCGVTGLSLYEYSTTKPAAWNLLNSVTLPAPRTSRC
jgi:hypothetical protein